MKAVIFLIVIGSVIALMIWRMRKFQAEAARAEQEARKQRNKETSNALEQDLEVIWPVIIRPGGKHTWDDKTAVQEPTMTSIDFEPVEPKAARQGRSR